MNHPEKYPAQILRGVCHGVNSLTYHMALQLDLGFGITSLIMGELDNLSLPRYQTDNPDCSESHAQQACISRIVGLVSDKPVMVIPYMRVFLNPMPPTYAFNVFYYLADTRNHWHSLEDQLVREGHAAWLDSSVPIPSLS